MKYQKKFTTQKEINSNRQKEISHRPPKRQEHQETRRKQGIISPTILDSAPV